ncbi:MAG: pyruvate formate lyase family protein [Pseudomonadales bacterium]|jgi:formate C-acetyltransferase|nr:pyruvate formate lyase family protein [Pseudomonadales bacterium]MDP7597370.1 pyruvate formate lyase family protein [Pseudomonadales bacterium]HJN51489.1 pyruvate formate lyase family protein [Pseudomonadales bacterium]
MLDVVKAKSNLLDGVITMKPTERVARLKQRYLDTQNKVVIDILRIRTEVMKETEGEPRAIQQAKAFAATVRGLPLNIYPDELLVGWLFSEPHGSPLMPGQAVAMERELDTLETREYMPFLISDDVKRELREEIIPYWRAHLKSPSFPSETEPLFHRNDPSQQNRWRYSGIESLTHWTGGFDKVLEKGILGMKRDAEERLARLDPVDPEDFKKVPFVEGAIIALEAAAEIGDRFAARVRELASDESDERKAELLKIAEVCDRVPAHPASTFYEAVQSVWFLSILYAWDNEWAWGISPGRADQYLYPYYENDLAVGRITEEEAQELIDCWFMRNSQFFPIMGASGARWSGPHSPGVHMDVGGLNADGTDGSTALSYMFIEARMHTLAMVEPTLGLLVHSKTPEALLIKSSQLTSLGGGWPMFINQDLMVENLLARGEILDGPSISLELARGGCCIGCHEPTIPNMTSGWGGSGVNLGQILELVLTNGRSRASQEKRGPETGDPRQFKSFEELREAFSAQVAWQVKRGSIAANVSELALRPKVFTSSFTDDCLENGLSMEEGGARYNVGAVSMIGTVDAGNSLAAIKRLVFDDKKITMDQLCQALDSNFDGHADIRRMCQDAPKFGNDDDYVDEQVAWVTHIVTEEAKKYKTTYGGRKLTVMVPMYGYVPAGIGVGALPFGRLAGEPLADGVSPTQGTEMDGPTAVLKSVGKVNNAAVSLSQTLNMRVEPSLFDQDDGYKRLADLIRVFVDQKVDHLQINVVSSETLRAAQEDPDAHKELTVKVAGYNARFIELHKELQDSIIARTEQRL